VRRVLAVFLLTLAFPAAAEAQTLSIGASPPAATYGETVTFSGMLAPAQAGVTVALYRTVPAPTLLGSTTTAADGSWSIQTPLHAPGPYVALAQVDPAPAPALQSSAIGVTVHPKLSSQISGKRVVGARLVLRGRVQPAAAGKLFFRLGKKERRVPIGADGRFRLVLLDTLPGRYAWRLRVDPHDGYAATARGRTLKMRGVPLAWGARGPAVLTLERRLNQLRYALRGVNSSYGEDTYQAVLAFQKVHGLARTGRVSSSLWPRLRKASVPRARVPRGDHIEISKAHQVMYEVRNGKVVKVVHVSTGATGNTPVGTWRVYRLGPGGSLSHMYYSLYFLRGFAIHGYHSVPPYPASHGCVRTPLWFAKAFYYRWARIGTVIHVFP
jgi:hypothetical protein